MIQSFPVSRLNRDDLGSPKFATFGGIHHTREHEPGFTLRTCGFGWVIGLTFDATRGLRGFWYGRRSGAALRIAFRNNRSVNLIICLKNPLK
ncbi:MAG: type I-E CRISPR-associated protein Cas7/Cse4/CasC [Opitutaceae bacterium]